MRKIIKAIIRFAYVVYSNFYGCLCGEHPVLYPWHFQWHALRELNRDIYDVLPTLRGRVLDLGCGNQPYRHLLAGAESYTCCDIEAKEGVDVVVEPGKCLPFDDNSFDAVFSSQVFEHVADINDTVSEIRRVMHIGGTLVVSVPFMFQLHGAPHDYRRLSEFGVTQLLKEFDAQEIRREGAIGSALAVLLLGWINTQMSSNTFLWAIKALLISLWIPFCLLVNVIGLLLDCLDTTESFYHNVLVVARKK